MGLAALGAAALRTAPLLSKARTGTESAGLIRMTDVTEAAGIDFTHFHGGSGRHYYVETMSGGATLFDFDGDGWLDILLVQSQPLPGSSASGSYRCALYRNDRDGTFTDVVEGSGLDVPLYGFGASVGDYDNDGRPDLYLTSLGGNHLFHNAGGGKFRDVTAAAGVACRDFSTSSSWLDYDNDGFLDLFVCRYMDYDVATNPRCRDQRGRSAYCSPSLYKRTRCVLYRNRGNGTFEDVTVRSGIAKTVGRSISASVADFNDDGRVDIFVTNDMSPNALFINLGDGKFRDEAALAGVAYGGNGRPFAGMGTDCGDFKNNSRMGLMITNFENEPVTLYSNDGTGVFEEESATSHVAAATMPFLKWGCKFVDMDLDGVLDIFIVNGHVNDYQDEKKGSHGYAQTAQILRNGGGGVFQDVSGAGGDFFRRKQVARALAVGDINNDGAVDAVIGVNNGPAVLLRNDSPKDNHWMRIELHGSARPDHVGCNRDALGARVRVTVASGSQTQFLRSGGSYIADHDRRLVFGVADSKTARVEVRWPCGAVETANAKAGETLSLTEGACRIGAAKERLVR